jgi:phytanoyl-CoA dioxygenase PhyH
MSLRLGGRLANGNREIVMTQQALAELSTLSEEILGEHVRQPTADEVAFYQDNGWVKLPGLLSADLAALILEHVQSAAGYEEGVGLTNAYTDLDPRGTRRTAWYSTQMRESDEVLRSIAESRQLGAAHAKLLGAQRLRLWSDSTNTKPPGADATGWHQDMQAMPFDRTEGGGIWVALVDMTPEMAPLQHLTGSHREKWTERPRDPDRLFQPGTDKTLEELFATYEVSPAQHLSPGDAIAHHVLTFHGTVQGNETDRIRWAWITQRFPADINYIDKHNTRSNDIGLEVGKPFDHPSFPVVCE